MKFTLMKFTLLNIIFAASLVCLFAILRNIAMLYVSKFDFMQQILSFESTFFNVPETFIPPLCTKIAFMFNTVSIMRPPQEIPSEHGWVGGVNKYSGERIKIK